MRLLLTLIFGLALSGVLAGDAQPAVPGWIDQLLNDPTFRGVASVRVESTTYIGLWTENPQSQKLQIFEMDKYPAVKLVAEFKDPDVRWQSLTAIQDGAVAGFQVRRTTGEGWFGATTAYFYMDGRFRKVFESGNVAEFVDLDGDGYPEALEYKGEKSDPACRVKISAWRKGKYQFIGTVPVSQLFSFQTRKRTRVPDYKPN
jgi:hypothetical protein